MCYRPGVGDVQDPQLTAALECVERDPELARWFEDNCAFHEAIRAKLKQIPIPAGLKEQIISERPADHARVWWRQPTILVAAAVLALLLGLASLWLRSEPEDRFSVFRRMMVRTALRTYAMDLETNDLKQIRAHLAQRQAPADYVLPQPLERTPSAGCVALTWHDKPVSMVCFRSGRPLPAGTKSDLFLFVIDRADVTGEPVLDSPQFHKINKVMTASWSQGDKTYLLAARGDESFLRKFW
jgi:hypothetical protein